jgi:D-alanyl-D-alanine carboxypeptidase
VDQRKKDIKDILSGFAVVLAELGLMVLATFLFVSAFNYVDAKRTEKPAPSSTAVSAAAPAESSEEGQAAAVNTPRVQAAPKLGDWQLVLVNYDNRMPDNFLHTIVHQFDVDLDSRIVVPFQKMRDAAQKDNIKIWISSGYRTPEKQETLFNQEIQAFYSQGVDYITAVNRAEKSVARAGYSEHNTGLALDLNGVLEDFDSTPESKWLQAHAQDYGFVLRYPKDKQELTKIKYEPWHYRYVGVENAKEMKRLGMCLEEYIRYIKENESADN